MLLMELLLKIESHMEKESVRIRLAKAEDCDKIYKLMREVYEGLERKELYVCDEKETVKEVLEGEGFGVVACSGKGEVVGAFLFRYPGESEENLGRDIGLSEDGLERVVHMESVAVHPNYRKRGLQAEMLRFGENYIDRRRFSFCIATVSPDNPASFKTFEKNGYVLALTKEKYGGFLRRIYVKEIYS